MVHPSEPRGHDEHDAFYDAVEFGPALSAGTADGSHANGKLKALAASLKAAPRRALLRLDTVETGDAHLDDAAEIHGVADDPAFDTAQVAPKERAGLRARTAHALGSLHTAAHAVAHPMAAAKNKTAARMQPPKEHPYLTRAADGQLLDAHEQLQRLESASAPAGAGAEECAAQRETVHAIESRRAALRDAYITSRHVERARVVVPGQVPRPRLGDYRKPGRPVQWQRYLAHALLWLTDGAGACYVDDMDAVSFKRGTLVRHAERLLMATTPWQAWLLTVRKVYMWDDPLLTLRWLALYLVLLKTGLFMTALYSQVVYMVVKNRLYPVSAHALREAHARSDNGRRRVLSLSELVQRHGAEQWLDPLLDELGPILQQQLGDLADFLEVLHNFYAWASPRHTLGAVVFWATCAVVAASTSAAFGSKIVWTIAGVYFFGARPIASRHPRYRHLVSVSRWAFWGCPTHAEHAFKRLQVKAQGAAQAQAQQAQQAKQGSAAKSGNPEPPTESNARHDTDTPEPALSFRGRYHARRGRLVVGLDGLQFVSGKGPAADAGPPLLAAAWADVRSMRKVSSPHTRGGRLGRLSKLGKLGKPTAAAHAGDTLVVSWAYGAETRVALGRLDDCFNSVIGMSNLRWQVLAPADEAVAATAAGTRGGGAAAGGGRGALDEPEASSSDDDSDSDDSDATPERRNDHQSVFAELSRI